MPITHICCKGLLHIESNTEVDPEIEKGFNGLLQANEHFHKVPTGARLVVVNGDLDIPKLMELIKEGQTEDIFAKVGLCRPIIESSPDLYEFALELRDSQAKKEVTDHLNIQIHMRRGDLLVGEQWRMLPNSYYVGLIHYLNKIAPTYAKTHTIHIHTEAPTKDILLTSQHHGVSNRVKGELLLKPSDYQLEDFELPNVVLHNNEPPWTSVRALQDGDILVLSHSSFSIMSAIMNPTGIILYHPFWHKPMSKWLNTTLPSFPAMLKDALAKRFLSA
jgi:hypothetical protein